MPQIRLLAADMLAWENSGFSVDASVRITLIDRDVPSYFRSLEHLLRYCARPPFALERLSVIRGPDHVAGGQPTEGCCDTHAKPRSHDTSRIAWAKLMARVMRFPGAKHPRKPEVFIRRKTSGGLFPRAGSA